MAAHPMQAPVVSVQPTAYRPAAGSEMWSSSLFSCCDDMGICCFGMWCPHCLACQVSSDAGECLCLPMLDGLTGGMIPAATMALRSTLRERYHIRGSVFGDCCIATYCNICAWCQMARELKYQRNLLRVNTTTNVQVLLSPPAQSPPYAP
ncbi:cornifelin homolog A-like [Myripristis murdjan]|uniref:cornifelin homolog A-like n=1 Tax=Myripristis murdjan TaxID=586833 RepID=UPI001176152C|nr:cornifelin homolog A-like [Myripristis murdjan]